MDNVENFWELNTPEMHLLFWRSVLWVNDLTNQPVGHSHHTNQQDTVHKLQQENRKQLWEGEERESGQGGTGSDRRQPIHPFPLSSLAVFSSLELYCSDRGKIL